MSDAGRPPGGFLASLTPAQRDHVAKLLSIAKSHPIIVDTSPNGTGKSYAAGAFAEAWGYSSLVVVCPASVVGQWLALLEKADRQIETVKDRFRVFSYGMLKREISSRDTAETLAILCDANTLFVFDEAHRLKNAQTGTFSAVGLITRHIARTWRSRLTRALLLSGTLYDKPQHSLAIARLLGIVRADRIYYCIGEKKILSGGAELIDFVKTRALGLSRDSQTPDLGQRHIIDRRSADQFAADLMSRYVLPLLSSTMSAANERRFAADSCDDSKESEDEEDADSKAEATLECANVFVEMSEEDLGHFTRGMAELADGGSENTDKKTRRGRNIRALMAIETAKAPGIVRLALAGLRESPNTKVVCAVNYLSTLDLVVAALQKEIGRNDAVVVVTGATTRECRSRLFASFQAADTKVRALVSILDVIAVGVDLDDQDGRFPRIGIAAASYFAINQHQFVRRFFRRNTIGHARVKFVYGSTRLDAAEGREEIVMREDAILSAITTKSRYIESTLPETVGKVVLFARSYQSVSESGEKMSRAPDNISQLDVKRLLKKAYL